MALVVNEQDNDDDIFIVYDHNSSRFLRPIPTTDTGERRQVNRRVS